MVFTTRLADSKDYEFLFELKKVAEYEPIKAIFGWNETVQRELHHSEWLEAKPMIIEIGGVPVGSFLVQARENHVYFGRFFLLPECQGKGVGSQVLKRVIATAHERAMPIKLCYLQGNRVGELYVRFGFEVTSQDSQFVYMVKPYLEHSIE